MKAADILKEALSSSPNSELLSRIRENAPAIIDFLESIEGDEETHFNLDGVDSHWLGEIFGVLNDAVSSIEDEQALYDSISQVAQLEKEIYGVEFQETLLPDLPPEFRSFETWFDGLATVDLAHQHDLLDTPSAGAAPVYAPVLAAYGLTPLSIFHAMKAVSNLIWRWQRHGDLPANKPVVIDATSEEVLVSNRPQLGRAIVAETQALARCSADAAHRLVKWGVSASVYKPWLFRRFETKPVSRASVRLWPFRDIEDVFVRWHHRRDFVTYRKEVGELLGVYARDLEDSWNRRKQFSEALQGVSSWNTAEEMIMMAHESAWPAWSVTCLPDMYLVKAQQPDGSTRAYVWEHVFSYIPDKEYRREVIGEYCQGLVLDVEMPEKTADFVAYLAPHLEEKVRRLPGITFKALKLAASDAVHNQIDARQDGKEEIAAVLKKSHDRFIAKLIGKHIEESTDQGREEANTDSSIRAAR